MVDQLDVDVPERPTPTIPPRRWLLAIATASCTGAILLTRKSAPPAVVVTLALLAALGSLELARREARNPGSLRPIVWSITALYSLAVIQPPRFATDIWSYTMVGRILAVHHLSPYHHSAASVSSDPLLYLLKDTWRYGTTPYGPLFVLQSGFVSLFSGEHPLAYRVAFQLTAAVTIGIALWLLWRETHSTAAVALVGLNPAIAGSIVNGGHNDSMIALGLLGIVLLLARGRALTAGWVLGGVVLLKLSIGFAVLPLVIWTAARLGRRGLFALVAPTVLIAVPLMFFVGALHSVTSANEGVITRMAIWNVPLRLSWLGLTGQPVERFAMAGMILAAAVGVFGGVIGRGQPDPGRGAAIGSAAWLVATGYVLAWYTVLGLLVAALHPRDRLARWIAVQGGFITAVFLIPREDLKAIPVVGHIVMFYVPLALAIGFVWAMVPYVAEWRHSSATDRTSPISRE